MRFEVVMMDEFFLKFGNPGLFFFFFVLLSKLFSQSFIRTFALFYVENSGIVNIVLIT